MVEVEIRAVRVDLGSNTPVLLLQETGGERRTLPIFIGSPEAAAIAYGLQGVPVPRPLTHDLMRDLFDAAGIVLERVVINDLQGSTYYAELHVNTGTRQSVVSARPSDAVAIALRTQTPIFVADDLMDAEGLVLAADENDDDEPEEIVEEFREFLDSIRPEDFSS
jgi:hypothetical protein